MRFFYLTKNSIYNSFVYLIPFIIAIFSAIIIRTYFFEVYSVVSTSMKPNLIEGDYILVNKFKNKKLERGFVYAFKKNNEIYVKRLIALPGDTLSIIGTNTYINNEKIKLNPSNNLKIYTMLSYGDLLFEETINDISYLIINSSNNLDINIYDKKISSYFFLGDNRNNSEDSRYWDKDYDLKILGKVSLILFSSDDKNIYWNRFFKFVK